MNFECPVWCLVPKHCVHVHSPTLGPWDLRESYVPSWGASSFFYSHIFGRALTEWKSHPLAIYPHIRGRWGMTMTLP